MCDDRQLSDKWTSWIKIIAGRTGRGLGVHRIKRQSRTIPSSLLLQKLSHAIAQVGCPSKTWWAQLLKGLEDGEPRRGERADQDRNAPPPLPYCRKNYPTLCPRWFVPQWASRREDLDDGTNVVAAFDDLSSSKNSCVWCVFGVRFCRGGDGVETPPEFDPAPEMVDRGPRSR
ncbi:unnamed protein product [Laminaria digitata]